MVGKKQTSRNGNTMDAQRMRAKGTSVGEAYERLRADILDLTLPPGSLVDEREQVARLCLSRTPIHEAFVRLAAEGLIIMEPNRQAQVAPLDIRDLPHYVEATDLAHRTVVHLAARRRDDADLAAMRVAARQFEDAIERADALLLTEANRHFHSTVASACHNPHLFQQYDRLLTLGLRILRSRHLFSRFEKVDLQRQAQEHTDLIEAIAARDQRRAEKLAHLHTKAFVDRYVRSLQENLTSEIDIRF